jgi:Predicted permease
MTLVKAGPVMLANGTEYLKKLPQHYPDFFDASLVDSITAVIQDRLLNNSGVLVSFSFTSLMNIAVVLVYMVLVPLLIFFMLKDKDRLLLMMKRFLPNNRELANRVWLEMNEQITNYIRGKVIHILAVSAANYVVFAFMGINYALLLGISVGCSVLIPYIGAVAVTIPVTVVALFQWGLSSDFAYLMLAYAIVQTLDANILTPLLFSETMNLHPIAIILAVLVFGGLWGFWGVFFAIPLATLVKAVVNSWPGSTRTEASIGSY